MIRVFVVDDSAFVRKALVKVLSADPAIRVVGEAADGFDALEKIPRAHPDLVTLDVDMQGMNGLQVLRGLLSSRPDLPVVMLSVHTRQGAEATLEALNAGAVDFIDKTSFSIMDLEALGRELVERIKVCTPRVGEGNGKLPGERSGRPPRRGIPGDSSHCELCVMGASTGGPAAIQYILERLPSSFPLPIALVQHMPPGFTQPFAQRLDGLCRLRVSEAVEGDRLRPGRILVAPAGQHLRITSNLAAVLTPEPHSVKHIPSVDVLMQSATRARPGKVLAILLTGMGEDGAEGMAAVRAQGGLTIAESDSSCVVYGMPRAAQLRGGVCHMLPLPEIAQWMARIERD